MSLCAGWWCCCSTGGGAAVEGCGACGGAEPLPSSVVVAPDAAPAGALAEGDDTVTTLGLVDLRFLVPRDFFEPDDGVSANVIC